MLPTLRFLTCGSVDDGKSTLVGRLLYEAGQVFDDHLSAVHRDSSRYGTQGENLDFALLVDGLQAEREQGITIDVAYRYFSTAARRFIVADSPGHEEYTRNMATAASTAEVGAVASRVASGMAPSPSPSAVTKTRSGSTSRRVWKARSNRAPDWAKTTFGRTTAAQWRSLAWSLEIRL
jgi:translation elongation factor EF-Tu-like GTPase